MEVVYIWEYFLRQTLINEPSSLLRKHMINKSSSPLRKHMIEEILNTTNAYTRGNLGTGSRIMSVSVCLCVCICVFHKQTLF